MDELFDTDATAVAAAAADGRVSAREVTEFALGRIAERDGDIGAVVSLRADQALAEAAGTLPDGPLHGVPYVIKDLGADVTGLPSTEGSRLFADVVAETDSRIVRRLREAGAVIVGKTNSPEFGMNATTEPALHGPTRNPHDLTRSPGGSSGGASAAVAAGMVPAAHASDGGGSIRIPAAMTGLIGLKPSRGRVPTGGNMLGAPVSVQHAITRTVRDTALLLDVVAGPDVGDPLVIDRPARPYVDEVGADPGRLRIALSTVRPDGTPADPQTVAVAEQTAAALTALGHEVTAEDPDYSPEDLVAVQQVGMAAAMAAKVDARLAALGRELRDGDLEPSVRMIYDRAAGTPIAAFAAGMAALERLSGRIGALFTRYDLLLTPTIAATTPALGLLDAQDPEALLTHGAVYGALTAPFNATGQPAISLPMGTDDAGLPVGAQLVAGFGREDLMIRIAAQLEADRGWDTAPVWPPRG